MFELLAGVVSKEAPSWKPLKTQGNVVYHDPHRSVTDLCGLLVDTLVWALYGFCARDTRARPDQTRFGRNPDYNA